MKTKSDLLEKERIKEKEQMEEMSVKIENLKEHLSNELGKTV